MEYIGIDVPKKQSQLCPFTAAGEVLHQRIDTHRERFAAVLPSARRAVSCAMLWCGAACGGSGWCERCDDNTAIACGVEPRSP